MQNMRIQSILAATAFAVTSVVFSSAAAHADASRCYSIQNRDKQNYCLATVKQQTSYCYSIQDRDFQNFCLAQVKGQKSYCYSIQGRDAQKQCLAQF